MHPKAHPSLKSMAKISSMPRSSAEDVDWAETDYPRRELLTTPDGWAFLLITAALLYFLAVTPRPNTLPDQLPYLEYFRITNWDWVVSYIHQGKSALSTAVGITTDELGWRLWIILVNSLGFTPEEGIRVTIVVLNALVACSLSRLNRPLLGLLLWMIIPSALAIVGLFQIRQGFAFSVAMLFAINFRRPILGALIASTIHTTFAVPAVLLIAARMFGPRPKFSLPAVGFTGIAMACAGSALFKDFGGRRVSTFAGYQDDFTARLLILVITYGIASAIMLYTLKPNENSRTDSLRELATMHLGLIVYLIAAFVVFPMGKDRVFYYVSLMLPYFVQTIRVRSPASLWFLTVLVVTMGSEAVLAGLKGAYDVLLNY
jgi:hypothetical protein